MSKVEIKNDAITSSVVLNGTDISRVLAGIELKIKAGRYPEMILHGVPATTVDSLLNNATVKSTQEMLQMAAEILRTEFMQKGDWYNALVASIYGYLREVDGSIPYDQMAVELANRIIGIESDWDDIENLDLTVRTYNCLKRAGVETVSQLHNMYSDDLMKIRNFNQSCMDEIAEKMENYKH